MNAQGLIVSQDEKVSGVFRRAFDSAGIHLGGSSLAGDALNLLARNKYDAVVINCTDSRDGYDVLTALRRGRSNKSSIAFAVTSGQTSVKMAYDAGATFVVEKPITHDRVAQALRAAYGLILRERRRYSRHPLDVSMFAKFNGEDNENDVRLLNVSEGGMAISTGLPRKIEGGIGFRVRLPESASLIAGSGDIVWKKNPGHLGIKFAPLANLPRQELDKWLARQMRESNICASLPYRK